MMKTSAHIPVMLQKVIEVLQPRKGESYLDATAGYGGHAAAVLALTGPEAPAILVDRDAEAARALARRFGERARVLRESYAEAAQRLGEDGTMVDLILMDLGVSSPQFDVPERGFSFAHDGPLDMRMNRSASLTAADIVNKWPEAELARVLREYGEEPKARAVARSIARARPFGTTTGLAKVVRRSALGGGDIDAATRTFQALRIAVNDELAELERALPRLTRMLNPGGRIAVISFHSLEDRIVKRWFDFESRDCVCPPKQPVCTCGHVASVFKINSKPLTADQKEIANNPRARSAKLRAAEKINKNKRRSS
jgi:16S rRNA (cytosine1402-N4)-methyltransferase